MKGRFLAAVAATLAFAGVAVAATSVTTIESKVKVVPASETSKAVTYKVVGPDSVEYVLDAPSTEVEKLAKVIETNPDVVVKFDGTVVEGPTKTFKVTKWENTDGAHTETHTETSKTTTTTAH